MAEERRLPQLSPIECQQRAEDCAEGSEVNRSVMWSLLAIAGHLTELRRELRKR